MNLNQRLPHAFHMLVIDDDRNQFTVEGPMDDDTGWLKAVREAQKLGRGVRCFNPNISADKALAWGQTHGYLFVACGSIVRANRLIQRHKV